jgi:N-acetylglucosamine-6-phosphate deacetylase
MKAYFAQNIFTGKKHWKQAYLIEKQGVVSGITHTLPDSFSGEIVDLKGYSICPQFVDLQIYGGGGSLFNSKPTAQTIANTFEEISAKGTNWFQITLSTIDLPTMLQAIDACKQYWQSGGQGLIGLHLEGPYFNPAKRGAHVAKYVRKPTVAEIETLLCHGKDVITYMTIAPEMFDDACLNLLANSGIALSLGHSDATYEQAQEAFASGISRVTHLYNAMSQFQSRAPGLVGATYLSDAHASIVNDGVHVSFQSVAIAKKLMGSRLFYITDAVTDDVSGEYAFRKSGNYFVNSENTLAGSALSMFDAISNGVKHCDISWEESIRMGTSYPAEQIGLGHKAGYLEQGYPASFYQFECF